MNAQSKLIFTKSATDPIKRRRKITLLARIAYGRTMAQQAKPLLAVGHQRTPAYGVTRGNVRRTRHGHLRARIVREECRACGNDKRSQGAAGSLPPHAQPYPHRRGPLLALNCAGARVGPLFHQLSV